MGYYPSRVLVDEAVRCGVEVLPIDIHRSSGDYLVENGAIRISFRQLKGMSEEALKSILSERERRYFTSLMDFVLRTNASQPIVENLVKVGAFDCFGDKDELLSQIPGLIKLKNRICKGTMALFEDTKLQLCSTSERLCDELKDKMLIERDLLSLNLSAHPLDFLLLNADITRMMDLRSIATGKSVKIAGSVIRYQTPPTRNGNRVVYVIMEDGTGVADVTVFGDVQEKCGQVLFREGWLVVEGKIQRRGPKALSIIAEDLHPLDFNGFNNPSYLCPPHF